MKKIVKVSLMVMLAICISTVVYANEINAKFGNVYIDDVNHYLKCDTASGEAYTLSDLYVLDYYTDCDTNTVFYSAIKNGVPGMYSIQLDTKTIIEYKTEYFDNSSNVENNDDKISLFASPDKSVAEIVDAAMTIIYRNEGSYGSVNKDDNGAVSIGKVQWHANRALNLLKTIVNANASNAKSILGTTLYNEIINSTNWSTRVVNATEASAISNLLTTSEGKAAQDALAATDITAYVNHGINLGIVSSPALVYFSDLENQWGSGGAGKQAKKAMEAVGSYDKITLDSLHSACLAYSSNYHSRRNRVYEYCKSLGWSDGGVTDTEAPINTWISCDKSTLSCGENITINWAANNITGYWLCIYRNGGEVYYNADMGTNETVTLQIDESGEYLAVIDARNSIGHSKANVSFIVYSTVVLDSGGGTVTPSFLQVFYGGKYGLLPIPQRDGYTFLGWGANVDSNTYYTEASSVRVKNNHTLYAQWKKIDPYVKSQVLINNGLYSVIPNVYNVEGSNTIIVAGYKDRRLIDFTQIAQDVPTTLKGNIDEIKVMVFDSLSGLKPLCQAEVIPSSEFITE